MLVTKDGSGRFESKTDAITLHAGPASVFDSDGSALVVHVGVDDYVTDPTGNAGDRAALWSDRGGLTKTAIQR